MLKAARPSHCQPSPRDRARQRITAPIACENQSPRKKECDQRISHSREPLHFGEIPAFARSQPQQESVGQAFPCIGPQENDPRQIESAGNERAQTKYSGEASVPAVCPEEPAGTQRDHKKIHRPVHPQPDDGKPKRPVFPPPIARELMPPQAEQAGRASASGRTARNLPSGRSGAASAETQRPPRSRWRRARPRSFAPAARGRPC